MQFIDNIPESYWADYFAAVTARLDDAPPATADQERLLAAIDEINAGHGFPITAANIIVTERASTAGWRCSFLDGPLPQSIADFPILPQEERLAERALAWGMNTAEHLYGAGNA